MGPDHHGRLERSHGSVDFGSILTPYRVSNAGPFGVPRARSLFLTFKGTMQNFVYLRRALAGLQSFVRGPVGLGCYMAFHCAMVLFAVVLIATAVYPPVHAQTQVQELARRVTTLENMDLSGQLAAIHQQLLDMREAGKQRDADWKPLGTAIAAGALVLERAVRAMTGKVKEVG